MAQQGHVSLAEILQELRLEGYALTLEEYGIRSLADLPDDADARDELLAELGITPNDRHRLDLVRTDPASLVRMSRKYAPPPAFDAASVREQRRAFEAQKLAFEVDVAAAGAFEPARFSQVAAERTEAALNTRPVHVIDPTPFRSAETTALFSPDQLEQLERDRLLVLDRALPAAIVNAARAEAARLELEPTIQGETRAQRGDSIAWVDVRDGAHRYGRANDALAHTAQLLCAVCAELSARLTPPSGIPERVMVARYRSGDAYPPHFDAPARDVRGGSQPADERSRRVWTILAYLNEGQWTAERGGALKWTLARESGGSRAAPAPARRSGEVLPVGGRVVIFDSTAILHEVLPTAHGCERFAMTMWTVDPRPTDRPGAAGASTAAALPAPHGPFAPAATAHAEHEDEPCGPTDALVLFASVGAPLESCAGTSSVAIETADLLQLLARGGVPCAHVGIAAEEVCGREPLGAQTETAPHPTAVAHAAQYAASVRARLGSSPAVDWGSVEHGALLRTLTLQPALAAASAERGRTAQPAPLWTRPLSRASRGRRTPLVLVLDGYDVLHGVSVGALRAAALAQLGRGSGPAQRAHAAQHWEVVTVVRAVCETTRVRAESARALGEADFAWVPAANTAETLRASGVVDTLRVRTLPQLARPGPAPAPAAACAEAELAAEPPGAAEPAAGGRSRRFRFLCVLVGVHGWHFSRKGVDVLLRAFASAFGPAAKALAGAPAAASEGASARARADAAARAPELLLKLGTAADASALQAAIEQSGLGGCVGTQLQLLHGWTSAAEVRELVAGCDVLVMPSRGEGWCRPLADAMAAGKPVVGVPACGGPADFLDETVGWTVRAEATPVCWVAGGDPRMGVVSAPELGSWAEPSADHLAAIMSELHACGGVRDEGVAARARAAQARMLSTYSEDALQARVIELVGEAVEVARCAGGSTAGSR